MDLEIDRSGQLSYFLCDLGDLCVNLSHTRKRRTHTEVTKVAEVLKIVGNGMDLEINRSGQLSYFHCDPLSDLRDLCVNLSRARPRFQL